MGVQQNQGDLDTFLSCDADSSACQPAPTAGGPCNPGFECALDAYCDASDAGTCQARVPIGEPCEDSQFGVQCEIDATCTGEPCRRAPAQACEVDPFDTVFN